MASRRRRCVGGLFGLAAIVAVAAACSELLGIEPGTPDSPDAATEASIEDRTAEPPPDVTPPSLPDGGIDPAVAARGAIFFASCLFDGEGINRALQQIYLERTTLWFRSRAVMECLAAKSNGCVAVRECIGITLSNDAGPCDSGCTGSRFDDCAPPNKISVECSTLGLTCGPKFYCSYSGAQACDPASFQGSCQNGTASGCEDSTTVNSYRCADLGTSCETSPTPKKLVCKGTLGACVSTSTSRADAVIFEGQRCENGKLVACVNHGLATLDCASTGKGFSCFDAPASETNATAYCGTATECVPKSPWTTVAATCEGSAVVLCNGGRVEKIDCKSLGFSGCDKGLCQPKYL